MYSNYIQQRQNYKLVEKLVSGNFKTELDLLISLVKELVDTKDFEINGGRIWELNPDNKTYTLKFQYGNLEKIPDDYTITISDQPALAELIKKRVVLKKETDILLQEKGIQLYSMTGLGQIRKTQAGKFYQWVLAFNATEIKQSFFDELNVISSVTSAALRNLSSLIESEKIRKDIVTASEIQRNLLPDHHYKFHDFDIFGVCIPDSEVGGDYFDFIESTEREEEKLSIIISDAASKGLPAAIQALFVSGAIKMGMGFAPRMSELISRLNTLVYNTFPYERFVTLFYCELTLSSNRLVLYCNAGHSEPIHYRPNTDEFTLLQPTGGLLGIMQNQKFAVENKTMQVGDILVLYTDGITEALNAQRELFGVERLKGLIKKYHKKSSKEIAYYILEEVSKFTTGSEYSDDRTLVVVKRVEEKNIQKQ
ncbi:MAG: serine/threonine-protein phosphatase [Candidatus Kapabacteria bacterium]|nr:serine/threonine-protein phosphatase [Candidatus Kapabacteria bacterium]